MKTIAIPVAYNEEKKIGMVISRLREACCVDHILLVDDGSTDNTALVAEQEGAEVLRRPSQGGVGAAIRDGLVYAREHQYDIVVIMAGNNKDDPREIPRLIAPILTDHADFVQGSRYLPGGGYGAMPFYRWLATRFVHPFLFYMAAGHRFTDTTNGFRAFRCSIFHDPRIDLMQPWLDHYEMEYYLVYKIIRLGYRITEAPVTKIYPPKSLGYTKIKPITGWWNILKPLVYLKLGIKK